MQKIFLIAILLFLTFIACWSLFKPGLPPTHDGEYHVVRFYQFHKALQEGNVYPRWAPDLNKGYGVPLFNYVYPLPSYVASLLHVFGISFIDAFKLNMFIASLFGAVFMYLWVRSFWGNLGGVVASVFYTYSPYHFLDIYIRGSVGEVWALGLFPVFLWSVTKFIREKKPLFLALSSLSLSLVIVSHNILALMFFPFALSYVVFLRRYFVYNGFLPLLLGIGLAAIFWMPAIFERQYVRGLEIFDYKPHFVELYQLIFPSWGSGFSADSTTEGLSPQIGIANLMALAFSIFLIVFNVRDKNKNFKPHLFFIFWALFATFLMLNSSQIIWDHIPFMQYFQFPWRFLSIVILACSFLAGSLVYHWKDWKTKVFWLFLILLPLLLGLGYAGSPYHHLRDDHYYISRSNFIDGTNTPGDAFNTVWFNSKLKREKAKFKVLEGEAMVLTHSLRSTEYVASISAKENATIQINTAYFPGWQAFIGGKRIETQVNGDGLIQFQVSPGDHKIEVKLIDTPIRRIASFFSSVSFATISILLVRNMYTRVRRVK